MDEQDDQRRHVEELRDRADFLSALAFKQGPEWKDRGRALSEIQRLRAEADEIEAELDQRLIT